MASKKEAGEREPYPRFDLDRSSIEAANMRNISLVAWSERLAMVSFALLLVSCLCCVVSAIFVWKQPMPRIYVSTVEGMLIEITTWSKNKGDLSALIDTLEAENKSLAAIKAAEEKSMAAPTEAAKPVEGQVAGQAVQQAEPKSAEGAVPKASFADESPSEKQEAR